MTATKMPPSLMQIVLKFYRHTVFRGVGKNWRSWHALVICLVLCLKDDNNAVIELLDMQQKTRDSKSDGKCGYYSKLAGFRDVGNGMSVAYKQ